jgi:hypothetical protein
VGEKDGWFFLRAENFTFSSPKLRVKLTQTGGGSGNNGGNNSGGNNNGGNNQGGYANTVKCDGSGKCCDASGKCTTGNPVGNNNGGNNNGGNNSGGNASAAGAKTYILKCSAKGGKTWTARGVNPKCPKGYTQVSKKLEK